ncbi:MAG: hypothetical protein EOP04_30140 [Proteobacteria bacterium]|nr:MAG: hypothetical protein EOP04_30140 [Pseudomonadota bacterium]
MKFCSDLGSSLGKRDDEGKELPSTFRSNWWASERGICSVDDGSSNRAERIRTLSNKVVQLQARKAFVMFVGLATFQMRKIQNERLASMWSLTAA